MDERFYIDPDNAKCPECDGGRHGATWSTCPTCEDTKTWRGTLDLVEVLKARIEDLESDLKDARGEIADLKAEMEA